MELLELIEKTGSLRAAALRMGVSYMRAWNLVRYTNNAFASHSLKRPGEDASVAEPGLRTPAGK